MPQTNLDFLDVQTRITQAEDYVKDWHSNVDKWRNYYDYSKVNDSQYHDPTFTNTVDLSVGIMLGNYLRWHSFGSSPSKQEQEDTGKVEKLIEGTLFLNSLREERHILYELFLSFNRDGAGVLYSVFDPILAKELESTMDIPDPDQEDGLSTVPIYTEVPLRVQVIEPKKLFALPGGPRRWLMAGRKESMTVLDIELTYGVKIPSYSHLSETERSTVKGAFVDAWDFTDVDGELKVRNTIIFDGFAIRGPRIMDGYKDLPYTFQFFKPTGEGSKDWHNIMVPMESSLLLLEKSINRRAHQIDIYTGLPMISKTQPGRVVQVDPGLFNHVNISTDESIEFPVWPGNAPDVREHQELLRSRVQQAGFSDVMYGSGQSQIAGYALSQLGDQNRIRMEQPIKHLELLLSLWAKKSLAMLTEFVGDAQICVYGQYKGKHFHDYVTMNDIQGYAIVAEIRPKFPSEETRKVAMATQAKGILSQYTIMERYLDIEQPEDEEQRKMIEMATAHPVAIQYALISELKERADADPPDEIAKITLEAIMANGLPGMAGRPKEANNPEQLTGTQSPTGEAVSQAEGGLPPGQGAEAEMNQAVTASPNMEGGI